MNIFDGHEDKTPEELANELGISDLSVIESAGREVAETLDDSEIPEIENNIIDIKTLVDTNIPTIWQNIQEKERLEIGKK